MAEEIQNQEKEEWKQIKDSSYLASTFGRIKNPKTDKVLKPFLNTTKYEMVEIKMNDGTKKRKLVNRVIAETFLQNPDNKPFVDHIDNDALNNKLSNLRYATRVENSLNRPLQKNNTSGYAGVTRHYDRWSAVYRYNGKTEHLGTFKTKEEAIEKRKEAENKHPSEFRRK